MKNAIIYARYSSERQNEQSIESQLRVCNEYAQHNGLNIIDSYIDKAMTGTNDNRPAFQKMLSDSERSGAFEIVLVYAIDRFGRNSIEIAVNKQRLKKNGKTLISATQRTSENIDGTKNLDGILLENVYIGLAEYYSAELSQKVSRGLQENRNKGLFTGGRVPIGYKVINKKVVIDEVRAAIVLEMFDMYANGCMAKDIIAFLEERGITNNGKRFLPNAVYNILHNKKYIGIYEIHGKVYTNTYPAIVPTETFEKVRQRIEINRIGQVSRDTVFLLKGKVFCGYCGKAINGESGTSHTGKIMYYYKCGNKKRNTVNCKKAPIRKEVLEQKVLDMTMELFTSKVNLDVIADEIMSIHEKRRAERSVLGLLKEERTRAERSLNNVMTAIEEGIINSTTKARMAELERQIDELSGKILIEENKLENRLTREDVKEYLTHGVRDLSPQALIELLVHRIELYDDKIIIWFNYSDRTDPDDPDTDRRGFILSDKYSATATSRFVIIEVNTLFITINLRKKKSAPIFGTNDKKIPNRSLSGSTGLLLVEIIGLEPMASCMSSKRSNQLSYTSEAR